VTCVILVQGLRAQPRGSVHSVMLLTALRVVASFTRSVALLLATAFTPSLALVRRHMTSVVWRTAVIIQAHRRRCSVTDARFTFVICVSVMERVVMPGIKCCCLKQPAQ